MNTTVRDLQVGDIFTESGLTVRVTEIKRDDLVNGTENYSITAVSISYNTKVLPKMEIGLECYYSKKAETKISVKRQR